MRVKIKRIDKSLPLPKYETKGSVGFDLYCRELVKVLPNQYLLIPGNVIVKTPASYMLLIAPRSSTFKRFGLTFPHSIGVIDQDYCGREDEINILVFNPSDKTVTIEKGERIAQGIFVKIDTAGWEEIDKVKNGSSGGFGITNRNTKDSG